VATFGEANHAYVMYGPITAPVGQFYEDSVPDSPPQNYSQRASFEIFVYSRGSGTPANVGLLNIDGAGTGSIVNNFLSQFKAINA